MPAVDRNVLRIGVYELLWADGVPDGVAISEAVALVEDLSTDASPSFVNGVLARIKADKPTTALDRDPSVDAQPSLDPDDEPRTRRTRPTTIDEDRRLDDADATTSAGTPARAGDPGRSLHPEPAPPPERPPASGPPASQAPSVARSRPQSATGAPGGNLQVTKTQGVMRHKDLEIFS